MKRHLASDSPRWRSPQQSVSPETPGPFRQDPEHRCFDTTGDFSGDGVAGEGGKKSKDRRLGTGLRKSIALERSSAGLGPQ